jgi:excisionase family DNA binding protein
MKRSSSIKASTQHEENSSLDLSPSDRLLTDDEAAKILGVTPGTLQVWRSTGRYQLPFVKVGRNVRYVKSNLFNWILERTHPNRYSSPTTHLEGGLQLPNFKLHR